MMQWSSEVYDGKDPTTGFVLTFRVGDAGYAQGMVRVYINVLLDRVRRGRGIDSVPCDVDKLRCAKGR